MSMTAFVLLVFGVGGLVVLIWWVMLKAMTSKKSGHHGPVESASVSRARTGREPASPQHADQHRDDWHDDMHNGSAAEAEWENTEIMSSGTAEDIRRSAVEGTDLGTSGTIEPPSR